jgi:hypothetical protein
LYLLDVAGGVLPEGISFLKPGWWILHVLAVALVFAYGYRRGRIAERKEQREGTSSKDSPSATPAERTP